MIKKILKVLGLLIVLAVGGVVVKFYVLSPKRRPPQDMKAPNTPEAIARGKYLAHSVMVCAGCHSKVDETKPGEPLVDGHLFEGRDFPDMREFFPGHIRSRNLTSDKETGIGDWTDGELMRAMREGIAKNGRPLFPMMPYLVYAETLSDEDGLAIVSYLRTIPPIKNTPGEMEVDFPISMFARAAPKPLEKSPGPPPDGKDPVARGKWLLTAASCAECHTTTNERHEPLPNHYLAGGNKFPIPGKGTFYTANITSDKATGIGAYTDEDLMRVFNEGKGKAGRELYGMPWPYYGGMTDDDKKALIAALRTVPPIVNVVPAAEIKK
jgi:hypothetical protein